MVYEQIDGPPKEDASLFQTPAPRWGIVGLQRIQLLPVAVDWD